MIEILFFFFYNRKRDAPDYDLTEESVLQSRANIE